MDQVKSHYQSSHQHHGNNIWTAIYDYDAVGDDELSLKRGDIVEVLSTDSKISGDEGDYNHIYFYHLHSETVI